MLQQTLLKPIVYTGVGLHSGQDVELKLQPAPVDSGISFHIHTSKGIRAIKPRPEVVLATALATTLGDGQVHVSTVEHLLAALSGLGVDNVECHVLGSEIPIMDGSALPIMSLIQKVGLRPQHALRKVARIKRPLSMASEGKAIHARPYNGLYIDYTIEFPHASIGKQNFAIEITPETFSEIAYARTFGFMKDIEYLHSKNLALGGSLQNAIVLDDEGILNPEGLRSPDEFIRHKILDFVGDIAMFGMPLQGAFEIECSGHHYNNLLLRKLIENEGQYLEYVELAPAKNAVEQEVFCLGNKVLA